MPAFGNGVAELQRRLLAEGVELRGVVIRSVRRKCAVGERAAEIRVVKLLSAGSEKLGAPGERRTRAVLRGRLWGRRRGCHGWIFGKVLGHDVPVGAPEFAEAGAVDVGLGG